MKYSIVLPVRNGGHYVKECVNSILAQTINDFNLVVLDNNSTDGTVEWLESLGDKRIIIYRSEVSLTMEDNWGRIKNVPRNEFMTMIGHDDLLYPSYLEEMGKLIQKHPEASLYQTHYNFINNKGEHTGFCLPMDEVQYGHEFLACQMARTINSMGTGYMMRSSDYDALGGMPQHYPNLLFADYELWVRLANLNYKATSPEKAFSYRVHQSISRTTDGVRYQEAFLRYMTFLKELQEKGEQFRQVIARYGNEMLLYHCESLSHRLLKTPFNNRPWKVTDFINKCKDAANQLGLSDVFRPEQVKRIKLAAIIDNNPITRYGFYLYRQIVAP